MDILRTATTRAAGRSASFDFPRRADNGDMSLGFYDSSFDLKRGLDVCEAPTALLSDDVLREFRRQLSH